MQYPQTRYSDSLAVGISDSVLSFTVANAAPTRTEGILTIGRPQSNTEDIYYTNVTGNVVTVSLRGLSQTSLTLTSVSANKKVHAANETVEMTTHHNYDTDKVRKSENETITGSFTFNNAPRVPGILDANGNEVIDTPATASAVNQLEVQNAATGNNVIITTDGGDTNINLELQAKGTGKVILEDGAEMKTTAAPTTNAGIANKLYVDSQIAAGSYGNASTTVRGVSEQATDAEVAAQTATGATTAPLFINPSSTTVSTRTANKIPVLRTQTNTAVNIDPNLYDPDRLYAPMESVIGEAVSASDITNGLNLMYQSLTDMKWYKVTSDPNTWYYRLGILLDSAAINNTGKRILLKGRVTKTFTNINPSFTSSGTGTSISVGPNATDRMASFVVDNTTGPECVVTGGTISARQQGTPSGPLNIWLVLRAGSPTSSSSSAPPAVYWDETNDVPRGAIIASATIPQASFSGTFQNLPFSFGGNIKIPAGHKPYLVVSKPGNPDGANYYQVQSNAVTQLYNSTNQAWNGTDANAGNFTLTVTSTSPVGYGVKAYTGTNGSYGLTPTNPWSRVLGYVTSTSDFYFDPTSNLSKNSFVGNRLYAAGESGFNSVDIGFCPTEVKLAVGVYISATTSYNNVYHGAIRGDCGGDDNKALTAGDGFQPNNFNGSMASSSFVNAYIKLHNNTSNSENFLMIARLEKGFYAYSTYKQDTNYISGSTAGFNQVSYTLICDCKA